MNKMQNIACLIYHEHVEDIKWQKSSKYNEQQINNYMSSEKWQNNAYSTAHNCNTTTSVKAKLMNNGKD